MKIFSLMIAFVMLASFVQAQKTLAKGPYSIKYPANYKIDGKPDGISFSIVDSVFYSANNYTANINLTASTISGYTPKTYSEFAKTSLPAKIKGFKVLEEKELKQGGKTGYYLVFKGKQGNDALKWKQLYFIEKGKVYIVTFTCLETVFAEQMKTVSAALASFTVK